MDPFELFSKNIRLNNGDLVIFIDKYAESGAKVGIYLYRADFPGTELNVIFSDGANHPRLDDEIIIVQKFESKWYIEGMEQASKKFKVRDMQTGNFWTGKIQVLNSEPSWSKRGKTWNSIEDLKSYFEVLEKCKIAISPLWEIVEYSTTASKGERYPASLLAKKKKF